MRKYLQSTILLAVLFAGLNYGQTVFTDNFTYGNGQLLTSNGWTVSSGTINALKVSTPGLSMTNYPMTGGGLVTLTTSGEDDYKAFTPAITSGSVYLSFLINVQSAQTGDYFIALSPSTAQTNYIGRVHIKSNGSGFSMGLSKSNELVGGFVYGTTVFSFNQTYLVVVKYTFNTVSNSDDAITVYVLLSLGTATKEPTQPEVGPYVCSDATKTDPADLGMVTLRQGTGAAAPSLQIGGIRIATSWGVAVLNTAVKDYNTVPASYTLSQNYPNPFNPTTNISYQISQRSNVSVKIYDILGNELRTLVNEEKAAGSYDLKFDASNLTSGVYFYTIQAGGFTQTKKMILMK